MRGELATMTSAPDIYRAAQATIKRYGDGAEPRYGGGAVRRPAAIHARQGRVPDPPLKFVSHAQSKLHILSLKSGSGGEGIGWRMRGELATMTSAPDIYRAAQATIKRYGDGAEPRYGGGAW